MKRILTLMFLLMAATTSLVMADNYDSLWKQAEQARKKDLPREELAITQRIAQQAIANKDYGQLLAAKFRSLSIWQDISPDSLAPQLRRLELEAQQVERSNPALSAVYMTALYKVAIQQVPYAPNQEDRKAYGEKSEEYARKAMGNPGVLASTKSIGYEPLVKQGIDGKIFQHDLLHVIGFETQAYREMHNFYTDQGNRAAACVTASYIALQERQENYGNKGNLARIDSLISEYADLQEAGELAIERYQAMCALPETTAKEKVEYIDYALGRWGTWPRMNILRNAKKGLENPMFDTKFFKKVFRPTEPFSIIVDKIRNIQRLTLTVRRLNLTAECDYNTEEDYAILKKHFSPEGKVTQEITLPAHPAYEILKDSFQLAPLPKGTYLIEIQSDRKDVKPAREIIYVSDVAVIHQYLPNNRMRFVAVSSTSGQPLANATIILGERDWDNHGKLARKATLTTDRQGEAFYTYYNSTHEKQASTLYAYTKDDPYTPPTYLSGSFSYNDNQTTRKQERVFTDRSIYRPGQTVRVAVIRYEQAKGIETRALGKEKVTLTLLDANRKAVSTQEVTTDQYGTAWADFTLPSSGLTGNYTIRTDLRSSRLFKVEEYKRPTFEVVFPEVKQHYESGDTLVVSGKASTYAGIPVSDAKVKYQVNRQAALWCWWAQGEANQQMYADTLTTDSEGNFEVRIPLVLPEEDTQDIIPLRRIARFYNFVVSVDVTDLAGETHHGELSIPLGNKSTAFNTDLPQQMERDSLRHFTFIYKNSAGNDIAAKVRYRIDNGSELTANTNTQIDATTLIQPLHSGEHTLEAICGKDTLRHKFVVFTMQDTRPASESEEWFYQTDITLPTSGKPLYTQVGSSRDSVHAVYTIISGDQVLEQGSYTLSDSIVTRSFTYQESYGNGLIYNVAWIKDGRLHYHSFAMTRPLPDKRLNLEWVTFRDRLTPGQKEEWALRVTHPDGSPAKAQLMGVLYDKSLDQLYPHQWEMKLYLQASLPFTLWRSNLGMGSARIYNDARYTYLEETPLRFDTFDEQYFPSPRLFFSTMQLASKSRTYATADQSFVVMEKSVATGAIAPTPEAPTLSNASGSGAEPEQATGDNTQLRENLQETAFFYPNLETDGEGNVSLRFTLPESVTTWRMMGIAHDQDMRHGMIGGEVVARKDVMIQPNMPRFLRQGDESVLSARLSNTSEKEVKGKAKMELIDPTTMKTLYTEEHDFLLAAEETQAVYFTIETSELPAITICRVTASGKGFSDGERHYLPILSNKERVIKTMPLVYHQPGQHEINLDEFVPEDIESKQVEYTMEYTQNPAWMMIQALPSVSQPDEDNAISLISAYYANSLADHVLRSAPHVKTVLELWKREQGTETSLTSELAKNQELRQLILAETPWVLDADQETSQRQQLINYLDSSLVNHRLETQYEKLSDLQLADGSFTWWKGMEGSRYMTTAVAVTLARLHATVGKQAKSQRMIEKALKYLKKETHKEVENLRKMEREGAKNLLPSETAMDYLYIIGMENTSLTASERKDRDYLMGLATQRPAAFTIYGKARYATILALQGEKAKAKEYLQSLKEYSVYREDIGRYFDTHRAAYSWRDYRIPTEVAAIEALRQVTPEDNQTIEEMRRWLLSEKRTQAWDNPVNTVDAVYAFLEGNMDALTSKNGDEDLILVDGKAIDKNKASSGLGYMKVSLPGQAKTLTMDKRSSQTSWGTVYACFEQAATEMASTSSGISVKREIVGEGREVGQRIKVRITITADRDYDFVAITDKRAACLEPVNALSGYRNGYYVAPRDNATCYYLNQLRKGKLVIEDEYYIDRPGNYTQGSCQAECAYSTAFRGMAPGETINVTQNNNTIATKRQ